ncbi:MAG: tyrosine-type recombinase/integrase [bacterium]|nr:tyrosine-type recombinase/integrase [bacterium]MDE0600172.1 tyrosine-type recombinase/integrase [bacterium]
MAKLRYGQLVIFFEQAVRIRGKATMLRLGEFPYITLREARGVAAANIRAIREGRDPRKRWDTNFRELAMEYIELVALGGTWSPGGRSRPTWTNTLTTYAFPVIGLMHPRDIDSAHIMEILLPIWIKKHKTARDLAGRISKVLKYAKAWGYCDSDPAQIALEGLFPVHIQTKHRKCVDHEFLGEAMRIVAASDGDPIAVNALLVVTLTGVRSIEARRATWDQIDLDNRVWHIPAANIKNKRDHFVPLSEAVIALLKDTLERTGPGTQWVFPAPKGGMMHSDNLKKPLRDNGIDADVHGSRSSLRTWAILEDIDDNAAEAVLAHKERNVYVRTTLFKARITIMNDWADHLNLWPLPSRENTTP